MDQHAKISLALGRACVVAPFLARSIGCDRAALRALQAEKVALREELAKVSVQLDSARKELDAARLEKAVLAPTGRRYFFQARMRVLGQYGRDVAMGGHKIL